MKADSNGYFLWDRTFGGYSQETCYSVRQTSDPGHVAYVLAGHTSSYGAGASDFWLVKTGPDPLFPQLRVLNPNGGDEWRILQYDTVRWVGYDFEGAVKIELNRHYPWGNWEVLAVSTVNDGIEPVFVTDPLSDSCRVRISAIDDTLWDISDSNFSIMSSQGYLALVHPDEPETPVLDWNAGVVECPDSAFAVFRLKNFGSDGIVVFASESPNGPEFITETNCESFFDLQPGEMSTCSLTITYNPLNEDTHLDTILIHTDAINAQDGYVRIPLSGAQIQTPAAPEIVITTQGEDVHLYWDIITESVGGCAIAVDRYLVFDSEVFEGPYWYFGYTGDTTYSHFGAVTYADNMFYHVVTIKAPPEVLATLPNPMDGKRYTEEQVLRMIRGLLFAGTE